MASNAPWRPGPCRFSTACHALLSHVLQERQGRLHLAVNEAQSLREGLQAVCHDAVPNHCCVIGHQLPFSKMRKAPPVKFAWAVKEGLVEGSGCHLGHGIAFLVLPLALMCHWACLLAM